MIKRRIDHDPLHNVNHKQTGKKLVATSHDLILKDIKQASKKLQITINDLILACIGTSLKQLFAKKEDYKTEKINLVMPANIRYKHYESLKELKLENKFAPVGIVLPLKSDVTEEMGIVAKITKLMKKRFPMVYALYAISYFGIMFGPNTFSSWFLETGSKPFTLAFSNLPGLLKPATFNGSKAIKMIGYFVPAGRCAACIMCISYNEFIKLSCSFDSSLGVHPQELMDLMERNISKCLNNVLKK